MVYLPVVALPDYFNGQVQGNGHPDGVETRAQVGAGCWNFDFHAISPQ